MHLLRKSGILMSLLGTLIMMAPAQAEMISTYEILHQRERAQLVDMLEREEVQEQLIAQGVDPASALARVEQMTDEEILQLNGQISELPVGAGIGAVQLLLIIIIIILLV
jgi:hypothetical protein